ncbi:MAG: polysulfide reductase NrfD [Hyphomicrobiales bacterium]|nr:polysulfide reductase NrfD [Hyphomicrobiales bacterium]
MAKKITFRKVANWGPALNTVVALAILALLAGLGSAWYMEEHGHVVSGMNNQIVWGMPHVFAVFLIVAASGALNVASVSSVFDRDAYKPLARLSGLLAIALLAGGLMVLVLDLGRPERLVVAMTHYNFKSIFAWNIFLYTGFMAIVAAYLFSMMDRAVSQNTAIYKTLGWAAFIWRLILTTGTGSIFGFLVSRSAYDTAMLAPLFIAASLLYGTAFMILLLSALAPAERSALLDSDMVRRLGFLLIIFALAVLYFTGAYHFTKLYGTKYHAFEAFILRDGGIYPLVFWLGQIGVGLVLPILILAMARRDGQSSRTPLVFASLLILIGGLAQMYVVIIGGQAFPIELFPGYEVSSSFADGVVARYVPSVWEILLGAGGVAIALLIVAFAIRLMPFLPRTLERPAQV